MFTSIPLSISRSCTIENKYDEDKSVGSFLELLVSSVVGSCESIPEFGFIFKNNRFENVDEKNGKLIYYDDLANEASSRGQTINGKSTEINQNTFAKDLLAAIHRYEPRLHDAFVNMEYSGEKKNVLLTITGKLGDIKVKPFERKIIIHVW